MQLSGWGVTSHNRLTYQRSRFLRVAEVYDQSSTLEFCKVPEIDDPFEDYKDAVWNSLCTKNAKTNETGCDGDNGITIFDVLVAIDSNDSSDFPRRSATSAERRKSDRYW